MSNEEAKRIVTEGLNQRKAQRQEAEQEALLEQYEQDMMDTCNKNCADAKLQRQAEEKNRLTQEQAAARRKARMEAQAQAQAREDAAMTAVRYYGLVCLFIIWLAAVTRFPGWAALTLMASGAIFPAAYIFRLYNPIEKGKTNA